MKTAQPKAKKASKKTAKKKYQPKTKRAPRVPDDVRLEIVIRASNGEVVGDIAKSLNMRYGKIREIVLNEWPRRYPRHFARCGGRREITLLRANPLPEQPEK